MSRHGFVFLLQFIQATCTAQVTHEVAASAGEGAEATTIAMKSVVQKPIGDAPDTPALNVYISLTIAPPRQVQRPSDQYLPKAKPSDSSTVRLRDLETENQRLIREHAEQTDQVSALEFSLDRERQRVEDAAWQNEKLDQEAKSLRRELKTNEGEKAELEADLKERNKELELLERQLEEARSPYPLRHLLKAAESAAIGAARILGAINRGV